MYTFYLFLILTILFYYSRRWYQQPVKRRYVVACLAFFGFCVIYMLRVNLSVAIVAMTQNRTHTEDDGSIAVVNLWHHLDLYRVQDFLTFS